MATLQSLYEISHWNMTLIDAASPTPPDVKPSGIVTDLDLPMLTMAFDTTKRAGELGIVQRPKYFEETELTFTVKSVFKELIEALAKGFRTSYTLKATACLEADNGTVKPYVIESKVFTGEMPFGGLSADGLEAEYNLKPYYVKATLDTTIIIYDPRNYVFSINGTNLYTNIKTVIDPDTP